ncbi:esterase lipase [Lichtheimia corymbifera JMRC:FSU:9682]|uniref:Esterase lipase n=1 Tax=Lichtheimia corymbifera JMRC:FSU:9682 TaxID=1263082 RepID=A0A068RJU9_9FUNG|nr:esterase lipase [Lichtheimia corymbifera JMRC:FSU:9682]
MTFHTPIHPVYAASIEARKGIPPLSQIPLEKFREVANQRSAALKLPEVIEQDKTVEFEGRALNLTLLRPLGTENEILPVVIFYHGGGFVFGSKYTHARIIRDICIKNHVAVVFLDYSLAPEVKFPVIHEEAYATLQWVLANGKDIHVDTTKLALCGDSAGGNLTVAVALMAKQRGLPDNAIKTQIAIYPATADTRDHYHSYQAFGNGEYTLTREDMKFFGDAYYGGANGGDKKWSCPLVASVEELSGLPPALVFTAEADVLRDEGEEYARKLTEAGVKTAAVRMIGAIHGYITVPSPIEVPQYTHTLAMIKCQLDEAFGRS